MNKKGAFAMGTPSYSTNAGVTLIELMIALAVTGIVAVAIYTVYESQVRSQISQEVALEMQQGMRGALSIMAREMRTAAADPTGDADAEILIANDDEFHFTRDVTGDENRYDGDTEDANENIRYAINTNGDLGRDTGGGSGLQSILENADALNFVYLDREGGILNPGKSDVGSSDLDKIKQVQVTVVAHSGQSDRGLLTRYTDNITYKNQQDEDIFGPANDSRRRLRMTTTIACRNSATGM